MNRYQISVIEIESQTDQAASFVTAYRAVEQLDLWVSRGGIVTVILRDGVPIDDDTLRWDADDEGDIEAE